MPNQWTGRRKRDKVSCHTCGQLFEPTLAQARRLRCGQQKAFCNVNCYHAAKTGKGNPKWRGGTTISKGYRYVYQPEHPAATHHGYVLEHRLVMEKKLGRPLRLNESVHHIDGDTLNNKPDNLMPIPEAQHRSLHSKYRTRDNGGRFDGHLEEVAVYL